MVIKKLIALLRANPLLAALKIEPFAVEGIQNSIIYTFTPISDNNIVRKDRLEIHIISKDYETLFSIDKAVRATLLTTGDAPLCDGIYKVDANGGGTMEDAATGTKHLITYFYVVSDGGIRNNG